MLILSSTHALQNLNAVFRCNLFQTAPIKSVCRVGFLQRRRFLWPSLLNAFAKTALAALMMLGVGNGTVQAGGPCNGAAVNYNIPFVMHLCVNPGGCDDPHCFRNFDTMTWDNIEVRLRPGWLPGPYEVTATENACAFTHSIRVVIAPDGSHTIEGPYIGGLAVNVVDWSWGAYRFPNHDCYATAEADGTRYAGTVCGGAGTDLHGTVVLTVGPAPPPDENQTKHCDRKTSCNGDSCAAEPMARYSFHLMLASLNIEDTPISYNSPRGPSPAFKVVYNQREANQPTTFNYSNLGPKWTFNWLSYVTDDGPDNPTANPSVNVRGGGTEKFSGFDPGTNSYAPDKQTLAVLVWMGDGTYEKRFPDGSKEIFTKSDRGTPRRVFLTSVVDAAGNFTTLDYDKLFRITTITDSVGQPTSLEYDRNDQWKIATVTDPFNRSAHFEYKGDNGQLSKITDPIGIESQFVYEEGTNFIKQMTTPYGTTTFTKGESADSVRWIEATDPLGGKERVEYHDSALNVASSEVSAPPGVYNTDLQFQNTLYWNKKAMADAPGDRSKAQIFHWLTALDGKVSGILHSEKKVLESRVWYTYENQTDPAKVGKIAMPVRVARLVGGGATQLYRYDYNALGNLIRETDPAGRIKTYAYDTNNVDVLAIYQRNPAGASVDPDGKPADKIGTYTYNSSHQRLTEAGADGQATAYHYNSYGQVLTSTNAKLEVTTYTYDRDQNFDSETDGYLISITSPPFNGTSARTDLTYDEANRVKEVTKEPDHYKVTTFYDEIDRKTLVRYPDETSEEFIYVDLDTGAPRLNATRAYHRDGRFTDRHYNANRQIDSFTDPLGRTTHFSWCPCGGVEILTDPNGHVTIFNRDIQNRVYQKYFADTTTITYLFEGQTTPGTAGFTSRVQSVAVGVGENGGRRTNYSYETDNNINSVSYTNTSGDPSIPPAASVTYVYDLKHNRVKTMSDGTGLTTYDYNLIPASPTVGAGRLHTIEGPWDGDTITYAYDQIGRTVSQGIQGGEDLTVEYDSLGRVTWTQNALGHFDHVYDGVTHRLLQTVSQAIGQTSNYTYFGNDYDRRLQTLENLDSGHNNLSKFDYTYAPPGRGLVTSWSRQLGTTSSERWFAYDDAQQLLSARNNADPSAATQENDYGYDGAGNRTSDSFFNPQGAHGNGIHHTYTPSDANQIEGFSTQTNNDPPVNTVPIYDNAGNVTNDGQGKVFEWDTANRLVAINYGTQRSEFTYDGLARRVKIVEKTGSLVTSTKRFVWVGNTITQERGSHNQLTRQYFAEGEYRDKPYYYTRDHLGSIRELTNSDGLLVARYDYDPYGQRTKLSGTADVDFGYTGHYHHVPSGLILTLYRAYNPVHGRWISRDPIGQGGGPNLYEYASNNSINLFDPLGLMACYKWFFITYYNDRIGNHENRLTENDAATANLRYTPNGTSHPTLDPSAPVNQPYPNGMQVIVHRPNGRVQRDHRTINDSGAGWAYPRPGLPNGVRPEEWLDLWSPVHARNGDPEWDLVETDVNEDCCPEGWSADPNVARSENAR
jgi:RHS repeat-associated protein